MLTDQKNPSTLKAIPANYPKSPLIPLPAKPPPQKRTELLKYKTHLAFEDAAENLNPFEKTSCHARRANNSS